ncbi:MAG: hypothetical protein ACFFED_13100 [Candidatus Thorarchaeota archaeon]
MNAEENGTGDTTEMAEAIVDAVEEERSTVNDEDALTKMEREVEADKEQERIRRAKELKKQLRRREIGLLYYRWPAAVLILSGILAIATEFLPIWVQEEAVFGFYTFWEGFIVAGSVFWLFPIASGAIMIVLGYFAYARPKTTFLAVIPAMLMAMAGSQVYFLITAAYTAAEIAGTPIDFAFMATGTPLQMIIVALLALLSIAIREKE